MTQKPKGTAAAVLHYLKENPRLSQKQLASKLNVTPRRIQQITRGFGGLLPL